MNHAPHRRALDLARGLAALTVLGVLLAGVPATLITVSSPSLPTAPPTWTQITTALMWPDTDNRLFLHAVTVTCWAAWAMFVTATITETLGYLARRSTPALPRPARPAQLLARNLVTMAALAFTTTALTQHPASAEGAPPPHTDTHSAPHRPGVTPSTQQTDDRPPASEPEIRQTRMVRKGDTLWSIARRHYGTGTLYPAIFKASKNVDQPRGAPPLTRPDQIQPGQRLRLPHLQNPHRPPAPPLRKPRPARPHAPIPKGVSTTTHSPARQAPGEAAPSRAPQPFPQPTRLPKASSSPTPRHSAVAPSPSKAPPSLEPEPRAAHRDDTPSAITLPSGSRIGLSLAGALALALAATRLHRRRRRNPLPTPNAPQSSPAKHTDTSLAEPVAQARKAFLDTYADRDQPIPTDTDLITRDRHAPPPDQLTLGTRNDEPITLALPGLHLGLTGDTTAVAATARAIAVELLAGARRDRAELLLQPDAQRLFPDLDFAGLTEPAAALPGLTLVSTLDAATAHLEAEIIHRARLLETSDHPDLTALRAADPAEPLPHVLLIATAPDHSPHTLHAVVNLGHRYGIGALLLGPAPASTTAHLNSDATITSAQGPHATTLTGTRLFHLTTDDAAAMLHALHTATGTPAPTPAPALASSCPSETSAPTGPAPSPDPEPPTTTSSPRADHPATAPSAPAALVAPPHSGDRRQPRPVELQLLGPVRLRTAEGPITTGLRRSARDLLAYLALHPDGITRDHAINTLWPDHDPDTATGTFNTAVSNIRRVLRNATGLREPKFLIHATGRYHLDSHLIDTDLWHLITTLNHVPHAADDTQRLGLLHTIADLYSADFAADLTHTWTETHREHLRRTTTDTLTRLAHRLQHHHPDHALTALEHAIHHDPYAEPLYRTLMTLQHHLGHPDAANRTYQLLTTRLHDLDTEPDDQTHQLHSDIQRRPRA